VPMLLRISVHLPKAMFENHVVAGRKSPRPIGAMGNGSRPIPTESRRDNPKARFGKQVSKLANKPFFLTHVLIVKHKIAHDRFPLLGRRAPLCPRSNEPRNNGRRRTGMNPAFIKVRAKQGEPFMSTPIRR